VGARPLSLFILCVASGVTACSRSSLSPEGAPAVVDAATEDPAVTVLRGFAAEGLTAVQALEASCGDRKAYLGVRRSLLASMEAWRQGISMSAEVAFGPPIAFDEAGGALGALDRAVEAHDCVGVGKHAQQIDQAIRLADLELGRRGIRSRAIAQALSDSAYDLGQALLESTSYVPEGDDAALADVLGLLAGIEAGSRALGIDVGDALAPLQRVKSATTLEEVHDRATLVRATGVLGGRLRHGARAYPRFPTLTPTDEVSAFTLPRPAAPPDPARAALGEKLFFDTRLSRGRARSCSFCHVPSKSYQDGLVAPASLDPAAALHRNTPTLLYAPLAALLTWDGRVRTADRQALSVIHTRAEMGLGDAEIVRAIAADPATATAFREAFGHEATAQDAGLALSAFESRVMVPGTAPIDRFAHDGSGLSDDARAGLDVFAGKGRCARCHVPPVFGGSRPPDFTVPIFSVVGVPAAKDAHALDADPGRGAITHDARDDHAFKVPSLRDVGRTAPYFHHGRFATLEDVVDLYDRGGGRGLGLDVKNQDPEIRPLHLTAEEKRVLLLFLRDGLQDAPDLR
jgi:cytochrome c peroxidase